MNTQLVWILLLVCGVTSIVLFVWILRLANQSKKELSREIADRHEALRQLYLETFKRVQKIDVQIIDRMRPLSSRGTEAHTMLRQMLTKIAHRLDDVERLRASGVTEDLVKAQTVLLGPIDNSGNTYDSLVFSETILTLQPDQFAFALEMICDFVERDLNRDPEAASPIPKTIDVDASRFARERKFTIRGFFKLLAGS